MSLKDRFKSFSASQDKTETILGKHLDSDFLVFPMAESAGSPKVVEAIGSQFGVTYPSEFCAHVCGRFPGLYVEVKESLWPRPRAYDVGQFWSFLYGLHSYSPVSSSSDWMRLDLAAESFQQESGLVAGPILKVIGDADVYCADPQGKLVVYDHELNELKPVDLNFWELLDRELKELYERKVQKLAER